MARRVERTDAAKAFGSWKSVLHFRLVDYIEEHQALMIPQCLYFTLDVHTFAPNDAHSTW